MNIQEVLDDRAKTHGDFEDYAETMGQLTEAISLCEPILSHVQKQALYMILSKISRIVNGNPNEIDHWVDIVGYTTLVINYISSEDDDDDDVMPL